MSLLIRHFEWTERNPWYPLLVSLVSLALATYSVIRGY